MGGAEVYLENLTRYVAETGEHPWQAELICRRDTAVDEWARRIAEWMPVERLDVGRPPDVARMGGRMRTASLVHLNLSYPAGKYPFAAAMLARSLRRPLVVTHHLAVTVPRPWHDLMGWLGRSARWHIAVSHHARSALLLEYGYAADRVQVIHNGIDPGRFRPATEETRRTFRRSAGEVLDNRPWGEDVLLACTVARLSRQKGLFELVDAADLLFKESPNLRIVVIGEGELRGALAERIRERHMEHQLFLTGAISRSRVAEWMAASDLFVLPSRYEGGPATALMEAMASECAVVATDVSGVAELVTDSSIGRLVPAQDPKALAESVLELISDSGLRASLARRGRERVLADFTIDVCLKKTEAVLEAALNGGSGSTEMP